MPATNFRQYKKSLHEHITDKEDDEVFDQYKQYSKKTSETDRERGRGIGRGGESA